MVNSGYSGTPIGGTSSGANLGLALGLGLGLGIPFVLAMIALTWFLIRRQRRGRQASVDSTAASNMTEPKQPTTVDSETVPTNA